MAISPLLMNYSNGTVLSFIRSLGKKFYPSLHFPMGFTFVSINWWFLANDNQAKLKISSNFRNHAFQEN